MAASYLGYTPGTPEWWMSRLVYRLMDRQSRYDVLEAYVEGNHPLPDGDERYVKALKSMQAKARTNYIGMITTTPVERMKIKDFLVDGEPSEDLTAWWAENSGDLQAQIVFMTAASLGNNFVKVVQGVETPFNRGLPKFIALDPRTTITEEDPADPMRTVAALELWVDASDDTIRSILYLEDFTYYFTGPGMQDCANLDRPGLTQRILNFAGPGLNLISAEPTPFGVVPVVRFDWRPSYKGISKAQAEDVIDVQNRINSTILDRMVISRSQAYKQRWAKGISLPKAKNGQAKPPFDPGSDMLWVTESTDASFGEFSEADIRQILEAIRDDVADMAAITKTPAHYLMGKMANVSGSTLDQAEAGMISQTKQRMTSCAAGFAKVAKTSFLYMGKPDLAKAHVEICWYDPAYHSQAESADALNKHVAAGVPLSIAAARFGDYSSQDLAKIAAYEDEQKAQEEAQRQQDLALKEKALTAKPVTGEPTPPGG